MRVLLTRPESDALLFAERLRQAGHEALTASVLAVRFRDGPLLELDGVQGVLATSANGVRALARRVERRDLPLFAVGPQTAQAARLAGFSRIESAHGDAAALAKAVPKWARAGDGVLLHATSAEGEGRLKALLAVQGYEVRSAVLYDVVASAALPELAAAALANGTLDAAFFFSPKSARAFRDCVAGAGLAVSCARLAAICISEATAGALAPLAFRELAVAAEPNQDALLACLKVIAGGTP